MIQRGVILRRLDQNLLGARLRVAPEHLIGGAHQDAQTGGIVFPDLVFAVDVQVLQQGPSHVPGNSGATVPAACRNPRSPDRRSPTSAPSRLVPACSARLQARQFPKAANPDRRRGATRPAAGRSRPLARFIADLATRSSNSCPMPSEIRSLKRGIDLTARRTDATTARPCCALPRATCLRPWPRPTWRLSVLSSTASVCPFSAACGAIGRGKDDLAHPLARRDRPASGGCCRGSRGSAPRDRTIRQPG